MLQPAFNNSCYYLSITEIDECSDPQSNKCSEYANCTNTDGDFLCTCFPGFTGDGLTCNGKESCDL